MPSWTRQCWRKVDDGRLLSSVAQNDRTVTCCMRMVTLQRMLGDVDQIHLRQRFQAQSGAYYDNYLFQYYGSLLGCSRSYMVILLARSM